MRASIIFCLGFGLLALTAGCKSGGDKANESDPNRAKKSKPEQSNHDRLAGTWAMDARRTIANNPGMKSLDESKQEELEEKMGQARMIFTKDSMVVTRMGGRQQKGTYSVKEEKGNRLVLEAKREGRDKSDTLVVEFDGDDKVLFYSLRDGEKGDQTYLVRR